MKLKILPPTLRKNNRYLALDIKSEKHFSKEELISAIWDSCLSFWGENISSDFNLWLMRTYKISNSNSFAYQKAIVRCQRGYEDKVRVALSLLNVYKKNKVSIKILGISGTIESSINKYID